ncbi:major facilitator superfamily domain-containing protein 6-like [Dendronephthya gigantea]|uniref:major facilitator superfamily domain-containing protein 6-like n=1 Tax=Dendronephthya gigantea TaxID=151771 RepID=UPI00106CB14F|nr:major facilitator superfamily domain-containing protein 6-like [Dendronephthya gigantea]
MITAMDASAVVNNEDEIDVPERKKFLSKALLRVNKKFLVSKTFYFFYWGAVGSFLPLLGVYFKQLGMSPSQSGTLVGCRPMVEFISAPMLGSLADKLERRKTLLIFSLISWISFTFSFAFIKPAPVSCKKYFLLTKNVSEISKHATLELRDFLGPRTATKPLPPEPKAKNSLVFSPSGVHQVFLVLLFLTVIGEFFSAPAITLADSATLQLLGDEKDKYGRQRLWGSLGWGTAMFTLGFVIDKIQGYEVCGEVVSNNYTPGFYFFVVLMFCALLVATRFSFMAKEQQPKSKTGGGLHLLRVLVSIRYLSFLFVAFFMGCGYGLISTFLYWHLEDLGGPPTLFGIASLLDHISEIVCYFQVEFIIQKIGHVPVLYLGLIGNLIRFVFISLLSNPWHVLPLEILQGITHAAVWASCTSYIGKMAPPEYATSAQGVLQGLYHGLGRGCGAILGGIFIHIHSTEAVFRTYGIACFAVLVIYFIINYFLGKTGTKSSSKSKVSPKTSPGTPPAVELSFEFIQDGAPGGTKVDSIGTYQRK